jgi:hypothetical protein
MDGVSIVNGSTVVAVRCARVWVEAYVPFGNYRGVPNDNSGKTWVPLDPAFKETLIVPGEDILAAMGMNVTNFLRQYIANFSLTNSTPMESFQQTVQSWLVTNRPGTGISDIERRILPKTENLGLLPASLRLPRLTSGTPFTALADSDRYKVRFHLYNGGTTFINFTTNVSALVGHRFHITYVGSTSNDQAVIDSRGGIFFTPPQLIRVRPVLLIDDVPVATSVNSIGAGYRHSSDMHFIQPTGANNVQPVVANDIIAGNSQAIGFDSYLDVNDFFLSGGLGSTNAFHEMLYTTAVDYLGKVDRGMEKAERLLRAVSVQDISEAIVESSVSVTYSFSGVPQSFEWTGLIVDADRRIIGPFAVDGNNAKTVPYMLLTGYEGSAMEHRIYEETYDSRAVSTIRALHISASQGIPICYITNTIASACPGFSHSSSVLSAVNTALSRGHVVIMPARSMTYGEWSGTGYIDLNPQTGAAGYIIAGGISGDVQAAGGAIVDCSGPSGPRASRGLGTWRPRSSIRPTIRPTRVRCFQVTTIP